MMITRKQQLQFIRKNITKDNVFNILNTFAGLFDNGIIVKLRESSIEIIYASIDIFNRHWIDLLDILKIVYPNIKHCGSYSMLGHFSFIYFYSI